ncbi:hypothetical protein RHSIM_Rhsim11G0185200 [Rhododendron simsii]|uniref:DDE Tnp4 domain-containing protein n=1 Tax=Rhododendron simsii TaxID=118357 RepID=A0A834GB51_RHOSS|nr:hypothetical protein RHSIM_Rhsim11G0185200 [Rhododendron simsii]
MAACSFNMRFTYALSGWEGTANDSRVFLECVNNPVMGFPKPPEGKYYVVDSGYTNMAGFLSPYRGERVEAKSLRHLSAKDYPLMPPPWSTIAAAFSPSGKNLAVANLATSKAMLGWK